MLSAQSITEQALALSFDLVGFAPAGSAPGAQAFLEWLQAGYEGEMGYLARTQEKRLDPRRVWSGTRTVVIVGVSYDTLAVPLGLLRDPSRGRIARYAWGLDYHDVITPRLQTLGERLARESRAYVDTGPVLERDWAERCGLGFCGKNTCLIHPRRGSYLFLGAVLLGEEVDDSNQQTEYDRRSTGNASPYSVGHRSSSHSCGRCSRCLVACPTRAFPQPWVLDARRCISYLTIELKGSVPVDLRPLMGNWIFGCDVCQDVCPYVRQFSVPTRELLFYPTTLDRVAPRLLDMLSLDRKTFNALYKGTALKRAKRRGLVRNACIAAGNWGSSEALPALKRLLSDEEDIVREHAVWAIARIRRNL